MLNMSNTNSEKSSLNKASYNNYTLYEIHVHLRECPVYSPLCMREVCWYSMYINAAALQSFFQYVARNLSSFISECGKQQETPAVSRLLEIQLDRCMQISSCKSSIVIFKFCPNIYLVHGHSAKDNSYQTFCLHHLLTQHIYTRVHHVLHAEHMERCRSDQMAKHGWDDDSQQVKQIASVTVMSRIYRSAIEIRK